MSTYAMSLNRELALTCLRKAGSWARRYLPAELGGTAVALLGIYVAIQCDASVMAIALIGAWSEVVGFYLAMLVQEWLAARPLRALYRQAAGQVPVRRIVSEVTVFLGRTMRNLLLEFGVAELVDPFILRPALLALAMAWLPTLPLAVIAGKVAADFVFYTLAIGGFELRQQLFGSKTVRQ